MLLKKFVLSLCPGERKLFAAAVDTSLGHLQNVMYGCKPCSPELASAIELESKKHGAHQTVKRWDLIPETWHRIWPELVGAEGAPELPDAANGTPFNDERRA